MRRERRGPGAHVARGRVVGLAVALLVAALVATSAVAVVLRLATVSEPAAEPAGVAAPPTVERRRLPDRPFDRVVDADRPTAHLRGPQDRVSGRRLGRRIGQVWSSRTLDGLRCPLFGGRGRIEFPSSPGYSIGTTGELTVELWLRPTALQFRRDGKEGYVHLAHKGAPGREEWSLRIYSRHNRERRPNRISGYAFNPRGGLGSGSFVQDRLRLGRWVQVVVVFDMSPRPGAPLGIVELYRNGRLRDTDPLHQFGVVPRNGRAPLVLGSGAGGRGGFEGAIGDVVIYDHALPAHRIRYHHWVLRG